ncbi:MAG: hypothetical protein M3Y87_20185 [Myxococcota bacterium]|nr:hypothetical protein [Myxococcota bacterium]
MRLFFSCAALPLLALSASSCGGTGPGGACAAGVVSLEILEPSAGEIVNDDTYDVRIQTCGVAEDEQIVLRLLQPAVTDYAFVTVPALDAVVTVNVPILPGTMELQAATRDLAVTSASVEITGNP